METVSDVNMKEKCPICKENMLIRSEQKGIRAHSYAICNKCGISVGPVATSLNGLQKRLKKLRAKTVMNQNQGEFYIRLVPAPESHSISINISFEKTRKLETNTNYDDVVSVPSIWGPENIVSSLGKAKTKESSGEMKGLDDLMDMTSKHMPFEAWILLRTVTNTSRSWYPVKGKIFTSEEDAMKQASVWNEESLDTQERIENTGAKVSGHYFYKPVKVKVMVDYDLEDKG